MTCLDSIPCGHCPACIGALHEQIATLTKDRDEARAEVERCRRVETAARALFLYWAPRNAGGGVDFHGVAAGEFPRDWLPTLRPFMSALSKALLAFDGRPAPMRLDAGEMTDPPADLAPLPHLAEALADVPSHAVPRGSPPDPICRLCGKPIWQGALNGYTAHPFAQCPKPSEPDDEPHDPNPSGNMDS